MSLWGPCKCCLVKDQHFKDVVASKEAHIQSLLSEISRLDRLAIPPANQNSIPLLSLEADKILTGNHEQIQVTDAEIAEANALLAERDRFFSGDYE